MKYDKHHDISSGIKRYCGIFCINYTKVVKRIVISQIKLLMMGDFEIDISIRILIVEEFEDDTNILIEELRSGGYNPIYEQINTPAGMIAALNNKLWDIILVDINMQKFVEHTALTILKEKGLKLPCIIVSDRIGEERVAKSIKDGVLDFMVKGNLLRLVPAIKSALHDVAVNKARDKAKRDIYEQREWFRLTLSSIGDGVVTTDVTSAITYMNVVAEKITGYSNVEAIGKPIKDIFNIFNELTLEPAEIPVYRVLKEGFIIGLANHTGLITKSGKTLSIADSAAPIRNIDDDIVGVVMVFRDITESKQLEEHLARLQQLQVVGQMAAGIAHEIRNPMTMVRGFLQLLQLNKECEPFSEHFGLMIDEIDRANSIITGFLSLAKDRVAELKEENLNAIVQSIAPIIQADAIMQNKHVHLELGDVPDLPLYKGEIHQLIINLARNGLEASPEGSGLIIKTYVKDDKVVLLVQDHGPGMDKEVLKKLGSPFLTTKKNGTGLGLPICYSIAEKNGAIIDIKTSDKGTTFFVSF